MFLNYKFHTTYYIFDENKLIAKFDLQYPNFMASCYWEKMLQNTDLLKNAEKNEDSIITTIYSKDVETNTYYMAGYLFLTKYNKIKSNI